jgi:hypothetical protein
MQHKETSVSKLTTTDVDVSQNMFWFTILKTHLGSLIYVTWCDRNSSAQDTS